MCATLLIGLAAFCSAFLGCLQAINVNRGWHVYAGLTSSLIGLTQLTLYKTVPHVDTFAAGAAFIVGGVAGSQVSMLVARRMKSHALRAESVRGGDEGDSPSHPPPAPR